MAVAFWLVLIVLAVLRGLTWTRTVFLRSRLAKYESLYSEAQLQLSQVPREGNSSKLDPVKQSLCVYRLGMLDEKRSALEAKTEKWQTRLNSLKSASTNLRRWTGRKLPYFAGVADTLATVATLLYMMGSLSESVDGLLELCQAALTVLWPSA